MSTLTQLFDILLLNTKANFTFAVQLIYYFVFFNSLASLHIWMCFTENNSRNTILIISQTVLEKNFREHRRFCHLPRTLAGYRRYLSTGVM